VFLTRTWTLVAATAAALTLTGTQAGAQGLFNSWFGGGQDSQRPNSWFSPRPPAPIPPQTNAYSDPSNQTDRPVYTPLGQPPAPAASSGAGTGHGIAYCVRTCDGRYFPMQRHANANPVQLCAAFCPAAKTIVFNGSQIDAAVAADGTGRRLQKEVDALRKAGLDVHGMESLKSAPKGYPKEHPRIELLRLKGLVASRSWPPASWLHTPRAKARVVEVFTAGTPLVAWLEAQVGSSGD